MGFDISCNLHEMSMPIFWEKKKKRKKKKKKTLLAVYHLLNLPREWYWLKCLLFMKSWRVKVDLRFGYL